MKREGPTQVTSLQDVCIKQISAGGWHSCFLTDDGRLFTCGKGEYGRLGLGEEASKLFPTEMTQDSKRQNVKDVVQVSAGGSHTIWFNRNNRVHAVGRLDGGRCGTGSTANGRLALSEDITPNFPIQDFLVLEVAAGGSHTLILAETSQPIDEQALIFVSSPNFQKGPGGIPKLPSFA